MAKIADFLKVPGYNARRAAESTDSDRDKLEEELAKIDAEYDKAAGGSRLPDPPEYEKLVYDAPGDEEIAARAAEELEAERVAGVEKIESDSAAAKAAKETERTAAAERAEQTKREISDSYDAAVKAFASDALSRGLARSSVAVNKTAELESGRARALSEAAAEAEAAASAIDEELAALEAARVQALNSFDIAHAAKVTQRISELTEEREKRREEVLKYNNELLEQANKDARDKAALESDLYTEYLNQLKLSGELGSSDPAASARNSAKYEAVRNYLLAMNKSDAAEAVRTDDLVRGSLTDYYYYKLYNEFCK